MLSKPSIVRVPPRAARQHPKVLYFSTYVSRESGASHALRELIRNVASRGLRALAVLPDSPDSREMFPAGEFDVVYLPIERPRRTWNLGIHARWLVNAPTIFFALRRLVCERGVDLVHCNEITDFLGGLAARSCGVPAVCHVRADRPANPFRAALLRMLESVSDAVVVPSKSAERWIRRDSWRLAGRTQLIYDCAFDFRAYDPLPSGEGIRREWKIAPGEILVLLVSKLVAPKGHECFIRAAEIAGEISERVRFVIVGGSVPGHESEAAAIHQLAREITPAPALLFAGPRADLAAVYAACDIAVHYPVYPDPYPTVVHLAMAAGKPVIGSAIGGIPEQIEHERTGLLVPAADPAALAAAILHLARHAELRASLGSAGWQAIRARFSPTVQAQRLTELYAHVLDSRSPKRDLQAAPLPAEPVLDSGVRSEARTDSRVTPFAG
jgi:glycosyltransferase involved in cell wall biosynthesis